MTDTQKVKATCETLRQMVQGKLLEEKKLPKSCREEELLTTCAQLKKLIGQGANVEVPQKCYTPRATPSLTCPTVNPAGGNGFLLPSAKGNCRGF